MTKRMTVRLPEGVKPIKLVKKHFCYGHYFCAHCGKEITRLNMKNGWLSAVQHFLGETPSGAQLRYCWNRDKCKEIKRKKLGVDDFI